MKTELCIQERFAAHSTCFGCGPANTKGLRIRSFENDEKGLKASWKAQPHHEAFPGMLNGGVIGALLDCHSNWTSAWHLMKSQGLSTPPCTVTAEYSIKLKKPTPTSGTIEIVSRVVDSSTDRATIEAEMSVGGAITATCRGVFVAVKPGHPAYHRW